MLNVLIVEDDLDLAKTIAEYLELEEIACDHASNGVAGLNLAQQNNFDVILLDLNLPRLDGLGVCQQLRQAGNDTPVLMITARDQLDDKIEGFRVGTDDYLVKPFELKELIVRINALARRRSGQAQLLRYSDLEMNLNTRSVTRAGQALKLSPTTWRLLEILLRQAPNVVLKQELEQAVWGSELPDSNSLKVHLFNLRKAIDAPYPTPLLQTIAGHGFALRDNNEN
jgi:DNA-binding response OmpR family regulator